MILINLLILPIVVSEAVQRLMKQKLDRIWDHILYYGWNIRRSARGRSKGWNILLCLWSGHVLTGVIRSLLLVDIQTESVLYSLLMAVCYSVICFLANLILKNVSIKVEFDHEEK